MESNLPSFKLSLEAREAAYLAARERIFAMDVGEIQEPVKHKPRTVPIVARRMIAHALGQRINSCNQDDNVRDSKDQAQTNEPSIQDTDKPDNVLRTETCQENTLEPGENVDACSKANSNANEHNSSVACEKNVSNEPTQKRPTDASIPSRTRNRVNKEYSKEQHLGAAKRMFANALGLRTAKDSRGGERKTVQ